MPTKAVRPVRVHKASSVSLSRTVRKSLSGGPGASNLFSQPPDLFQREYGPIRAHIGQTDTAVTALAHAAFHVPFEG